MNANDIFYKLTYFINDYLWMGVLKYMSYDPSIFDISAHFSDDDIIVRIGKEKCTVSRQFDNIDEIQHLMTLLKHRFKNSSEYEKYIFNNQWTEIKKKSIKTFLIENYVIEKYITQFDIDKVRKILQKIKADINLKKVNINFSEGKIISINPIS